MYTKAYHNLGKRKRNLGIELLRMILSIWIVIFHSCQIKNKKLKFILIDSKLHVPTFIIISFYFLYPIISKNDINKIKERLIRLFIPFFTYSLLIWLINNLLFFLFKFNRFNRKLLIKEMISQLLIGRPYHGVLWFHFNLIFFTLGIYIISRLFKKNYYNLFILQIIGIITYILQYSFLNYYFFKKYNDGIKLSIGYFSEFIPIAINGFLLSSINLIQKASSHRERNLFLCIFSFYLLFKYNIFKNVKGFNFQGINKNIDAFLLFISFSIIPIKKIRYKFFIYLLNQITKYTGGIYYLHPIVNDYLKKYIIFIKNKTIKGAFIIYIFCYFISFIGVKIWGKTILKHLFY